MDFLQPDFASLAMTEQAQAVHSAKPPATKGRGKARSPEEKIADLEKQQAQLAARVKAEKAKIAAKRRKEDTRRKIVAGAIALEHMEHDENFRHAMTDLLKKHVKETDLHLFQI